MHASMFVENCRGTWLVRKFGSNEWWQVSVCVLDFDVEAIREASTPVIFKFT